MFIEKDSSSNSGQPPASSSPESKPNPEPVRITLTGSRRAVKKMIQLLHQANIILGSDWSNAVAIKNSSEVIHVALRIV
ncbi:MAG: hypothetical protein ACFBSC_16030 [Microcoleaceae cyanobacterium]